MVQFLWVEALSKIDTGWKYYTKGFRTVEYTVGKMTANMYMMRYYISLYGIMKSSDAWLNSFIPSRLELCNADYGLIAFFGV